MGGCHVKTLLSRTKKTRVSRGGSQPQIDVGRLAEKVAKIVPAELITAYTGLINFARNVHWEGIRFWIYLGSFLICLVLTPYYLNKMAEKGKPKITHLILSTIAFVIWAYFISGQQIAPNWYDGNLASWILLAYSILTAFIPLKR